MYSDPYFPMRRVATLFFFIMMSFSSFAMSSEPKRLRVQLMVEGDDGLTSAFASQIRSSLAASKLFVNEETDNYDVRFLLAGGLYWSDTDQGTNFNVVVVVTDSNQKFLGISTGPCWEEEMKSCADRVLSEAKIYIESDAKRRKKIKGK